uniref:Peptidase S1 domain-containing protein n=1 Tax=Anopheles dirus TaxID=7168 RepID=A0A182NP87_9DIPT
MRCSKWISPLFQLLLCVSLTMGQDNPHLCGRRKMKTVYLIHNGADAKAGHWPWHAVIYQRSKDGDSNHSCGGSIIDHNTILTGSAIESAHCVNNQHGVISPEQLIMRVGLTSLSQPEEYSQEHFAREVIVHPGFDTRSLGNDIALVKLTQNITMSNYVQPVCLWTLDNDHDSIIGQNGTVVGFGTTENGDISNKLTQVFIGVAAPSTCIENDRSVFGTNLTSDMFCGMSQQGVSACTGDAGGGMFFEMEGIWYIRGIVSFGTSSNSGSSSICDSAKYTTFTDVAKYVEWIQQNVDYPVSANEPTLGGDYEEMLKLFDLTTCGLASETSIANGVRWTLPWLGFVGVYRSSKNPFDKTCAVTLLNKWYAVGPAHCFQNDGLERQVLFGSDKEVTDPECQKENSTCLGFAQVLQIQRVIIHPNYNSSNIVDNIALIELLSPADTSQPNVRPICLPIADTLRKNETNGLTVASHSSVDNSYRSQPVQYVDSNECTTEFGKLQFELTLKDKRLCAKMASEDAQNCEQLKAGTPLQDLRRNGEREQYFLRGFDLFGKSCSSSTPSVYNNVTTYLDWMLYNMKHDLQEQNEVEEQPVDNSSLELAWTKSLPVMDQIKLRLFNADSCGITTFNNETSVERTFYPWMGFLMSHRNMMSKSVYIESVVVLISEWYAIAPAHIVRNVASWRFIILGHLTPLLIVSCEKMPCDHLFQKLEIRNIILHPRYTSDPLSHDIALIEFMTPANLTHRYIKPICLPLTELTRHGKPLEFNVLPSKNYDHELEYVSLLNPANCQERFAQQGLLINQQALPQCAYSTDNGKNVLKSGALLQVQSLFGGRKKFFLKGINTQNDAFGKKYQDLPYLFTDTDLHLEWIVKNVNINHPNISTTNVEESTLVDSRPVEYRPNKTLYNMTSCGTFPKLNDPSVKLYSPWLGFVSFAPDFTDLICITALINEWYAVGPAHILHEVTTEIQIKLGSIIDPDDVCTDEDEGTIVCDPALRRIKVEKMIVHPQFNKADRSNNILLLKLSKPANMPELSPVCLPADESIRRYQISEMKAHFLNLNTLNYVSKKLDKNSYISPTDCQQRWDRLALNYNIANTSICVLHQQALNNDCVPTLPGFPMYSVQTLNGIKRHVLRGFAQAWPDICSEYYPIIYTDIAWTISLIQMAFCLSLAIAQNNPHQCGRRKVKTVYLIHNGVDAKAGHWPWHAAIYHKSMKDFEYACGGSIIDHNTILTAAHCVYIQSGVIHRTKIMVRVGLSSLKQPGQYYQEHYVKDIQLHTNFTGGRVVHDIALIKLTRSITMSKYVQPVCLWTLDDNKASIKGRNGTVVGFGITENGNVSNELKQALIGVVDPITCIENDRGVFGNLLTKDMICGRGAYGVTACKGDSGGGMFFEVGGKWYVRGIVSFIPLETSGSSQICDSIKYTAFTDVAKYLSWIEKFVDPRILTPESDDFVVDYEEKLKLFDLTTCGLPSETSIANGVQWTLPWLGFAGVYRASDNTLDERCAVTLLNEWYAVGPAHCFQNDGLERKVVFGGNTKSIDPECTIRNRKSACASSPQVLQIQRVIIHPKYNSSNIVDNIALIELLSPVDTSQPNVRPICLPIVDILRQTKINGFTVASHSSLDNSYRSLPVQYVDSNECVATMKKLQFTLTLEYNRFCAKMSPKDAQNCVQLKAGTPLQDLRRNGEREQYFLRGFDLFGRSCSSLTVYNNVTAYLDWILYNMKHDLQEQNVAEEQPADNSSLELAWTKSLPVTDRKRLGLFNADSCGITTFNNETSVERTFYPWMGFLMSHRNMMSKSVYIESVVVLISEWYAIAPAHIIRNVASCIIDPDDYCTDEAEGTIVCDPALRRIKIEKMIVHPLFNKADRSNNILLLKLSKPANMPELSPVCLPADESIRRYQISEMKAHFLNLNTLNYVSKKLDKNSYISPTDCQQRWDRLALNYNIANTSICVLHQQALNNDCVPTLPGFPMYSVQTLNGVKRHVLRGFAQAWPDICSEYYPIIYTDVAVHLDWMLKTMDESDRSVTVNRLLETDDEQEEQPKLEYDLREKLIFV